MASLRPMEYLGQHICCVCGWHGHQRWPAIHRQPRTAVSRNYGAPREARTCRTEPPSSAITPAGGETPTSIKQHGFHLERFAPAQVPRAGVLFRRTRGVRCASVAEVVASYLWVSMGYVDAAVADRCIPAR